jgi:hypothetical protein
MAFNATNVDPGLLGLIEGFNYAPYKVTPISGYRPGDPRQHGQGHAIDIQLIDPATGQALPNYQSAANFKAYQDYANALYQHALQTNPELAAKLRWGGYFSGPAGKYGAMDLMHFDIAGGQGGIPMAGGSWEAGLNPEQAKLWNIAAGGGVGASTPPASSVAGQPTTPPAGQYALRPEKTPGAKLGEAVANLAPAPARVGMGAAEQQPAVSYSAGETVPSVYRAQMQPSQLNDRQLLAMLMQGGMRG